MTLPAQAFPRTRRAFDDALRAQRLGGASLSASVDGREVVTLVGGQPRAGVAWSADTRSHLFSVSKGLAGIVVAMLVDRGRIDVDERVAAYWPEFAANGKQDVTVRMVLLHSSGVLGFPDVGSVLGWDGRGWGDLDAIAAALAAAAPAWEPGTRSGYHAVSYGWLVGELVRRTDGRTLGEFFRQEVAGPLGLRTAIGVAADDLHDIAELQIHNDNKGPLSQRPFAGRMQRMFRDPSTLPGKAGLGDGTASVFDLPPTFFSGAAWLTAEVPSSNGVSSARDLARLFAAIALGGELDGVRLLSAEALGRMTTPCPAAQDAVMAEGVGPLLTKLLGGRLQAHRCLALQSNPPGKLSRFGPGPRTVGTEGAGGQWAFADPDRRVSAAFVRSVVGLGEKQRAAIVKALYDDLG